MNCARSAPPGQGPFLSRKMVNAFLGDQVIREDPSAARGVAGAPKNRQRILSVHRGGWSWNAGPQQWYGGSEALQTAAQWAPPPGQSSPPPIRLSKIRRRKAPGGRGLGNLVRPVSPPGTRFPDAVGRPGGQVGDKILRSPRSAPPSFPCFHGSIGLFAPFHRPSVPM